MSEVVKTHSRSIPDPRVITDKPQLRYSCLSVEQRGKEGGTTIWELPTNTSSLPMSQIHKSTADSISQASSIATCMKAKLKILAIYFILIGQLKGL